MNQLNSVRILFLSNSKKRTKYFNQIKENCSSFKAEVYYYSNILNLKNLNYIKKNIDLSDVISEKIEEIEFKYKKRTFFKEIYKIYIRLITPILATNFFNYIKDNKIDVVAVWNGKKYPETVMLKIVDFLKLKKLFFENGLLPNTTVVDNKGVNYTNSLPRVPEFYKKYPINLDKLPKRLTPRKLATKKRVLNSAELNKDYIFVPFQTSYDSQILKHSPWIKSMHELFFLMYEIANILKINVIFKEHPSEKQVTYDNLHTIAKKNEYVEFANANNTQDLIVNAKAIVTINSSVGLESLLFNKKVIVLGEAFYNIKDLTQSATSKESLIEVLRNIDKWSIDLDLKDRFLSYLINEYLVEGSWKKPDENHFKHLERKINSLIKE